MSDRWNEAKVAAVLARRFKAPEFAFVRSVQGGTGATTRSGRQMDAFAMGLWPSRGMERHGFEIKVSRGDWLKELKSPEKCEVFLQFCHRWWIAVPDAPAIVHDLELPEQWGLIDVKGGKCRVVKEAPRLTPADMDVPFLAAILRRATEQSVDDAALAEAREEGRQEGHEQGKRDAGHASTQLEDLRAQLAEFADEAGFDPVGINRHLNLPWSANRPADLGRAVAQVLRGDDAADAADRAVEDAERRLRSALAALEKARLNDTQAA